MIRSAKAAILGNFRTDRHEALVERRIVRFAHGDLQCIICSLQFLIDPFLIVRVAGLKELVNARPPQQESFIDLADVAGEFESLVFRARSLVSERACRRRIPSGSNSLAEDTHLRVD